MLKLQDITNFQIAIFIYKYMIIFSPYHLMTFSA